MGAVVGIGVDVVDVKRMKIVLDARGTPLIRKLFTESEIAYCAAKAHPHEHYAARFAAKEAISKAMQTGWSGQFRWKDVEVINTPSGAPKVILHDTIAEQLAHCQVHISLSHTDDYATAVALVK